MKSNLKSNQKNSLRPVFLFSGLLFIFTALGVRWVGGSSACFWCLLATGIVLKAVFLGMVFREKGFRWSLGLTLILVGVGMILMSLLFKTVFPYPVVRNVLFFGAIALKMSGLVLLIVRGRRTNRED